MNALTRIEAASPSAPLDAEETRQYLTFVLGDEHFAIGILSIKEIIEYGRLTTVPMMPPFIRGVINLRGAVVPVVDLASRFGGAPSPITRRSCIVILELRGEAESQVFGVIVDAVSEVLEIPPADIEPPPAFGTRVRADFIRGMGKVRERFVMILEAGRILSEDDLTRLAEAETLPALPA